MKTTTYAAPDSEGFAFTPENRAQAERIVARYPEGRQMSAVLALLDIAQRQNDGWLSHAAIEHVAEVLEMAPIRVREVVSFYTMFYTEPVGKHLVQVCRTTPCWLRGSDGITKTCLDKLGIKLGQTTEDGTFTVIEVECLGACANAPMVQINDDYFEDLTPEDMAEILEALKAGKTVTPGPQNGRQGSAPEGGPQTLRNIAKGAAAGDGRSAEAGKEGGA